MPLLHIGLRVLALTYAGDEVVLVFLVCLASIFSMNLLALGVIGDPTATVPTHVEVALRAQDLDLGAAKGKVRELVRVAHALRGLLHVSGPERGLQQKGQLIVLVGDNLGIRAVSAVLQHVDAAGV